MSSVESVRSYISFRMRISFLYRKLPISFYEELVLQVRRWSCLQKFSACNFTLRGSLSEASLSSVNRIKFLQALANLENTEQTNKDNKLQDI